MTDVFISYARDDRERVRPVAEGLQAEGWDVWWDAGVAETGSGDSLDRKLAAAGAVLVMWSAASRGSEYVRSEAATGLYRNKLIQARIDTAAPPRPFDQVEVMDIGHWSGEREDPQWRRIVGTVKLFAGAPGALRPTVMRKAAAPPGQAGGLVGYVEPRRSVALAPILAVVAVALAGGGIFFVDPFNWRSPAPTKGTVASLTARVAPEPGEGAAPTHIVAASSPESLAAWEKLNRADPNAVRAFVTAHVGTSEAEAAKSTLRVLDAQAWATAVTIDTAEAYKTYLASFPAEGSVPGAMAAGAAERLTSLDAERAQAVTDIQRALTTLSLYGGKADGRPGADTTQAARHFASVRGMNAPDLEKAAPRDLRSFADAVEAETAAGSTPAARAEVAARKAADAEAERKRREDVAAAQELAKRTADDMAQLEIRRQAEARAAAEAAAAEAAKPKLPAFSPDLAPAAVRSAVESARTAAAQATARASAARQAAADADRLAADAGTNDVQAITAADGDRYVAQVRDGTPNGLGVRVSGDATSAGDKYRGELRNGLGSGLGVYEFGNNPNNQAAGALRYEGEHARDAASGLGVTYWKNGDRFAGNDAGATSRGVMTFADGRRYEGELNNGVRSGMGVLWNADGSVSMAGRWENGQLAEPAKDD